MIGDFISQVKSQGLARTNRYQVEFVIPNSNNARLAALFCDSVSLPGVNIATTPMRTYGESREMPYEKMYEPVTMSFYVDSNMEVKIALENWLHSIIDPTTRVMSYYQDYITNVDIYVLNVDDSNPYKVTLYEAYPKFIQAVQMDMAGREVMKVSVTMQFKYWKSSASLSGSSSTFAQDPRSVSTGAGFQLSELLDDTNW